MLLERLLEVLPDRSVDDEVDGGVGHEEHTRFGFGPALRCSFPPISFPLLSMCFFAVSLHVPNTLVALVTVGTLNWFETHMHVLMALHIFSTTQPLVTHFALHPTCSFITMHFC